jgi:hypothetical protein
MEHRRLGRTGVSVSTLCLGAMMFGDWGTKDHDESVRIIHRALDGGINFVDTVLDRIDEIVPPGVTINPADGGWVSPALLPAARRR